VGVSRYMLVYILVLVQELASHSNGSYALPTRSLESFSLPELIYLTDKYTHSRGGHTQPRSRRQINEEGVVYIAANFSDTYLLQGFHVGDGRQYRGYFNYPLTPGTHYQVGYRGTVPDTSTPLFLSAPAPVGKVWLSLETIRLREGNTRFISWKLGPDVRTVGDQMIGDQMVGGKMVGDQMVWGQMEWGQMVGDQMVGDQIEGV